MTALSFKKLAKNYGKTKVVKGIDLDIYSGEFITLVGPSGCGKSTTLRMIAGLEEITSGTVSIDDKVVNDLAPKNRNIAMVFQNYALYPQMTVAENMGFALRMQKLSKDKIRQEVLAAAKILSIEPLLDRFPRQLSGGQRQRVAMGRAIVRQPSIFLFDEPLSNLDAMLRVQMRLEIKKLHQSLKTTTVYVTHDQTEAMTLADRIVIMNDGIIVQIGTPMDVYERPKTKFVANFIGSPPISFFNATLENSEDGFYAVLSDGTRSNLANFTSERFSKYVNREVTVGIRPEHIEVSPYLKGSTKIRTRVDVVEPLGAESYIYFSLSGQSFCARVDAEQHFDANQDVSVTFSPDKTLLFDAETDMAI